MDVITESPSTHQRNMYNIVQRKSAPAILGVCVCPVVDWRSKVMSCPVPLSEWDNFDGD